MCLCVCVCVSDAVMASKQTDVTDRQTHAPPPTLKGTRRLMPEAQHHLTTLSSVRSRRPLSSLMMRAEVDAAEVFYLLLLSLIFCVCAFVVCR